MKNYGHLGGCYPPRSTVDNTLLDLQNSSYDTQPHSLIVNYPLTSLIIGLKLLPKKAPQELLPEKAPLESCIIGFSSPTSKNSQIKKQHYYRYSCK